MRQLCHVVVVEEEEEELGVVVVVEKDICKAQAIKKGSGK